jgi:hypothetical protein
VKEMRYEKIYWVKWTWRHIDKDYCYSGREAFNTKEKANAFFFELFHNSDIEILWCQKVCEETWKKDDA